MTILRVLLSLSFLVSLVGLFIASMMPTVCPMANGNQVAEICDRHGLLVFCLITVASAIGLVYSYETNKR
jgi:hypothetical protein